MERVGSPNTPMRVPNTLGATKAKALSFNPELGRSRSCTLPQTLNAFRKTWLNNSWSSARKPCRLFVCCSLEYFSTALGFVKEGLRPGKVSHLKLRVQ